MFKCVRQSSLTLNLIQPKLLGLNCTYVFVPFCFIYHEYGVKYKFCLCKTVFFKSSVFFLFELTSLLLTEIQNLEKAGRRLSLFFHHSSKNANYLILANI